MEPSAKPFDGGPHERGGDGYNKNKLDEYDTLPAWQAVKTLPPWQDPDFFSNFSDRPPLLGTSPPDDLTGHQLRVLLAGLCFRSHLLSRLFPPPPPLAPHCNPTSVKREGVLKNSEAPTVLDGFCSHRPLAMTHAGHRYALGFS